MTSLRRRLPSAILMLIIGALCIARAQGRRGDPGERQRRRNLDLTNKSKQMVSHLATKARILGSALRTEATFDVGQAAETVTV